MRGFWTRKNGVKLIIFINNEQNRVNKLTRNFFNN